MQKYICIEEKDITGTGQIDSVVYNGVEPKVDREGTRCFGMSDPTTWFELRARRTDSPRQKQVRKKSDTFEQLTKYSPEITIWFGNHHYRITFETDIDLRKFGNLFLMDPVTLLGLADTTEDIPGAIQALAATMFAAVAQLEVKKVKGLNVILILTLPGGYKAERVVPYSELTNVLCLPNS